MLHSFSNSVANRDGTSCIAYYLKVFGRSMECPVTRQNIDIYALTTHFCHLQTFHKYIPAFKSGILGSNDQWQFAIILLMLILRKKRLAGMFVRCRKKSIWITFFGKYTRSRNVPKMHSITNKMHPKYCHNERNAPKINEKLRKAPDHELGCHLSSPIFLRPQCAIMARFRCVRCLLAQTLDNNRRAIRPYGAGLEPIFMITLTNPNMNKTENAMKCNKIDLNAAKCLKKFKNT